jgi:hypothetical protein
LKCRIHNWTDISSGRRTTYYGCKRARNRRQYIRIKKLLRCLSTPAAQSFSRTRRRHLYRRVRKFDQK